MPNFTYQCNCGSRFERTVSMQERKNVFCSCGQTPKQVPTACSTVLKGDGWAGKNMTISSQMARKNARLDIKQAEQLRDAPGMRLAPNVGGERVDSWSDAQKLAKDKGLNTNSYTPLVEKEAKKK